MLRPVELLAIAGLCIGAWPGHLRAPRPAAAVRVSVLLSQDAAPYRLALEGFQEELRKTSPGAEVVVHLLPPRSDGALVMAVRGESPTLLLALGSAAVEVAYQVGSVPVVAGMVLRASDVVRSRQFTGVYLEFPAEVEFRYLERILPGQRRVAVLYNATQNAQNIEEARRAARGAGLELLARKVSAPTDIPATLQALSNNADVLWGLADTLVLTRETAGAILLFSLQNRIPFVGLSTPWVKAGAVYALERDYADIGRQCGELAAALVEGQLPAALSPVAPRKVLYVINRRTAGLLKLTISREVLQAAEAVIE